MAGPEREPFDRYVSTHLSHFPERGPEWYRQRARYFEHRLGPFLPADRGARILDAACGAGECVAALRAIGYTHVAGVDVSAEQLAAARAAGVGGLEQEDALVHLSARRSQYDCVIASHLAEHLATADLIAFLGAAARALAPRGRLLVLTPNAGSPLGLPNTFGDLTHVQHFTATSLAQAAALGGLKAIHVGGVAPDPRDGRLRAAAWRLARPVLRLALGSGSRYGAVTEPELIGVFEPASA